ncbi:MAG TPA: hypothetical protein VJN21_14175 [Candidatus Acidoferrales bacterium]|nr:hypothetical protein [Candidatus Acidoferrales bacterium]
MGNWRQIQGRIRRARTSADPVGKLAELYEKTRDAMVAFEAASFAEKSGNTDEAIRWFTTAANRFRRAEWRQKAADALTRLGAPVPEFTAEATRHESPEAESSAENDLVASSAPAESEAVETEPASEANADSAQVSAAPSAAPGGQHKRRRGRRGGRRHKRRGASAATRSGSPAPRRNDASFARAAAPEESESRLAESPAIEPFSPRGESEPIQFAERATYIRAGEPALASRFAHLESMLRRLVSSPLHRVDEVDAAPAGPGVFLLSDSDLTTNYYVEACQTLRVGAAQLGRSRRAGRGARQHGDSSLRAQLAEHLEIDEAKVSDYLKKHCVVRWLQLDTDAPHLAHFAIAVLRPVLNTE